MKVVEADEKNRILEYLKKDIANCIYLYLDILNYGISTDNVTVWMEEDHQGIQWIMMKYYDSFQIYSRNTLYELENILHLIQTHRVSMIPYVRILSLTFFVILYFFTSVSSYTFS